jgi:hypothetical protein
MVTKCKKYFLTFLFKYISLIKYIIMAGVLSYHIVVDTT